MSRLGKKPIAIPEKTKAVIKGNVFNVEGPQGTLSREIPSSIAVSVEDGKVILKPTMKNIQTKALWGTTFSHVSNMIKGVNSPFQKRLIIEGIGFKADVKGSELVLSLGFSHPVKINIPADVKVVTDKNGLTVSSTNIEAVGQFAAKVRDQKKPEPYKGKGIRYDNEIIRRKQGKKTA